ncbi:2906_t:CDS:2, partial [Dentiscutata erythropus]
MNESNFEENENYQENFQSENSQSRNFQSRNSQSKNSLNENSQESTSKKLAGRPPAGVWHFFDRGVSVKGHCSGKCKVCGSFWARAKPVDLEEHLALDCSNQDRDVIDFYAQVVANRQSHSQAVSQETLPGSNLNKRKRTLTNSQTSLSEFIESTKLTSQREDNINSALIKAFIVCNIPFHIISNPYFIDALRELRPGYQPPSRQLFAGRLLNAEIIKINQSIMAVLEKANNLTLGLDGWTDPNKKSLWNFVIHTSSGREYLWKILDLSNQSHTGETLRN